MEPKFGQPATDRTILEGDSVHNLFLGYALSDDLNFRLKVSNVFDDIVIYPSTFWTAIGVAAERSYTLSVNFRM